MGVFTLRPCASAGKQQVVLDFFEIGWSVIVSSDRSASSQSKQNYLAQRRGGAGLFAMGQYWLIDICGGKLLGWVDLRVDYGHFRNHMNSRSLLELIILSDAHASVADDTEVVPPKSNKQIQRSQHKSMPSPRIDDEPIICP